MTHRSRLAVAAALMLLAFTLSSDADDPKKAAIAVPKSPLTPEAEKATFQLAPGLRIDLIAAEPLIESPVFCTYDERGRLWVVEMRDYPNGPGAGKPGEGRIKILEDKDGDGRFDSATVFADELLFANSVLPWGDGAIVTAAPNILFLRDTDGDGKADVREVLYEGFVAGNPQLRVGHPMLGPDGWVYVANGLRGGEVRRAGKADAPKIPLGGKDFRFDMVHDRAEAIPGMGQFGNTFDRWGQRFVCDNRHHLRHVVFPSDPGKRNPLLAVPLLLEDPSAVADGQPWSVGRVFPLSRNWTTSNLHAGQFTAACGVFVDTGSLLPAPFAGAAFTCDPTGNLLHCDVMKPHGATFESKSWKEGVEFLASPDEWFRPVSLSQAPDGALLLVDMYRAVIEHPEFMPAELKKRPDLLLGKERGRIWRIAPEGSQPAGVRTTPASLPLPELVKQLEQPNGWRRTTAQRLLLTSQDPVLVPTLRKFAEATTSPDAMVLTAWLLLAKGETPANLIERMAASPDAGPAEHAARLLETTRKPDSPLPASLVKLANHPNARVRFQTALSLGAWDDAAILPPLAAIAKQDAGDKWTRIAVASAAGSRTATLVAMLLGDADFVRKSDPARVLFIGELCELIGSGRDPAQVAAVLKAGSQQASPAFQTAVLVGLADGVSRRGTAFPAFLASLPDQAAAGSAGAMLAKLAAPALDGKAAEADRTAATRLLAFAPWATAGPMLTDLLEDAETPPPVRLATIRSLAAHADPGIAKLLLKGWKGYTPSVRSEVLEALIRRPDRVAVLLDAVEAKTVKAGDIDPGRAKRLIAQKDAKLAARAGKLLKDSLPADRKDVLAKYRPALELASDPLRGQAAFKKVCAACHVVAGIGTQVGPDISDTRTKTPEMLLTDILNPNAAIDGNFVSYTLITKDGKQINGVIASESAGAITLKRENNQSDTVLRADVEEIRSSGMSLMPEGIEKNLSLQELADLIRFLKDWRYLDGVTPRGS